MMSFDRLGIKCVPYRKAVKKGYILERGLVPLSARTEQYINT
jgi:hypothetical protein